MNYALRYEAFIRSPHIIPNLDQFISILGIEGIILLQFDQNSVLKPPASEEHCRPDFGMFTEDRFQRHWIRFFSRRQHDSIVLPPNNLKVPVFGGVWDEEVVGGIRVLTTEFGVHNWAPMSRFRLII